ncbi:MAG: helix-turn-helix domain-containing protein [Tannerellaceae bacterium]
MNVIIEKLLLGNLSQKEDEYSFEDSLFRTDIMISNIEAFACSNTQSLILINYQTSNYAVFNYNHQLINLLGNKHNQLNKNTVYESINKNDCIKIERYIDVINKQFHCKRKHKEKNFYFTILFSYFSDLGESGCSMDFIPLLYNEKKELCFILCKVDTAAHAGKPILKKHCSSEQKIYEYLLSSKRFVEDHKVNLSNVECEILRLSGEGEKEHEIADKMELSLTNVKRYKTQIFEKMQVKSISEAIYISYKRGQL